MMGGMAGAAAIPGRTARWRRPSWTHVLAHRTQYARLRGERTTTTRGESQIGHLTTCGHLPPGRLWQGHDRAACESLREGYTRAGSTETSQMSFGVASSAERARSGGPGPGQGAANGLPPPAV